MADHDQRFKILLQEFFGSFFELFFPTWPSGLTSSELLGWTRRSSRTRRRASGAFSILSPSCPRGGKWRANVPAQPASWIALVHVEIESADSVEPLRGRMYDYYKALRDRHRLPVLPVGLYLSVGLDGIGVGVFEERFGD